MLHCKLMLQSWTSCQAGSKTSGWYRWHWHRPVKLRKGYKIRSACYQGQPCGGRHPWTTIHQTWPPGVLINEITILYQHHSVFVCQVMVAHFITKFWFDFWREILRLRIWFLDLFDPIGYKDSLDTTTPLSGGEWQGQGHDMRKPWESHEKAIHMGELSTVGP